MNAQALEATDCCITGKSEKLLVVDAVITHYLLPQAHQYIADILLHRTEFSRIIYPD